MMENIFAFWAVSFDLPILDWIRDNLTHPILDAAMPPVTTLGNGGIIWILLALVLLLIPKHRAAGIRMAVALLMGLLVCNLGMKPLFARIRPFDFQWEYCGRVIDLLIAAPQDYSFPSGHTIASFEAATVLLLYRRKWGIPALILAVLIAFSRLYLYVHYPTDVICSVILGVLIGILACKLVDLISRKYKLGETK